MGAGRFDIFFKSLDDDSEDNFHMICEGIGGL